MKMEINPKRILIATQGPNKEPYRSEIEILFKSLNCYGGQLKDSQKIACFTEKPDPLLETNLKKLGVKIKIVEPIYDRSPHSNKIQMLNLNESEDFDVLVALDSDIVVTNDFSEFIDLENFRAKPVDTDFLTRQAWKIIFNFFEVNFPEERLFTSFHNRETIPYFNSGVLIIPEKYLSNLYVTWKSFVKKLFNLYDDMTRFRKYSFFTDQIALSLAIADQKIPKKLLSLEMNFPTNGKIHDIFNPEQISPFLIHYHHFSETGFIGHCNYEKINKIIDEINETIVK